MSRTHRRDYLTGRRLRDGKAHHLNWSTPSWWNRLINNRPQRRAARRAEHRVMRDPDAADGLIWPAGRKPHIYFW